MKKMLIILFFFIFLSSLAKAEWTIQKENNEFENKKSTYIISEKAFPNKKLSFPYENTEANLIIGCTKYTEWVYFFFNSVNLNFDSYGDNGDLISIVSVKVGDRVYEVEVNFEIGSNFVMLNKSDNKRMLRYISDNNSIMVQFDHHSSGKRHFNFNTINFQNTFKENCI
jgi:hypothetical protein